MKWFSGSINEAVAASKTRKAIFVVFVAGPDEASIEATKVIDTPEISSSLEKDDFVAIKLESGSESYRFFAQIYQIVPIPSLFFIGKNGEPLEIVAGSITTSSLASKIDIVLSKAKENVGSDDLIKAEQNAAVASSSQSSTSNIISTNEAPVEKLIETKSIIDTSQTHTEKIKQDSSPKEASTSSNAETLKITNENNDKQDLTAEEKVERAKQLMELQKQQKLEKEREREKMHEKERREIGKQMQNARRQQQDLEMKLAHEERKKEKAAELEARERIRHQIAQDKLERKQREQALLQQTMQQQQNNQPRPGGSSVFPNDGNTRIQFRLPSGDPHTATFEATSTLRELRAYVVGNIDLPFQEFSLSMSFPRRDLNQEDDEKTLLELQLVPNAVILILPVKNIKSTSVVAAEDSSFLSRFVWALFAPILTVYNYLSGILFGTQTRNTNRQNDSSDGPSVRTSGVYSSNDGSQSTGVIRRNVGGPNVSVRGLRNVHRLHSGGDDNDENNTWNGNSTQQM